MRYIIGDLPGYTTVLHSSSLETGSMVVIVVLMAAFIVITSSSQQSGYHGHGCGIVVVVALVIENLQRLALGSVSVPAAQPERASCWITTVREISTGKKLRRGSGETQ